jgi:predicted lipoprotein with Yx(FWY)xxD motif
MRAQQSHNALKAVAGIAMAVLALAGCASSSKPAASGAAATGAAASGAATSGAAASGAAAGSVTKPAVVATANGAMGAFLADGAGRTLYLWLGDPSSTSMCTGQCATYWPPLLTAGAPTASGMAQSNLLSTSKRADGTTQVTYAGHPVYYFSGDKAAGATGGQGKNAFGHLWWVVSPAGAGITSAGSSSSAAAPKSGGGY